MLQSADEHRPDDHHYKKEKEMIPEPEVIEVEEEVVEEATEEATEEEEESKE